MNRCFYVSNRLPFSLDEAGKITRGSGGLVTALLGVKNNCPTYWVGATTDERIVNIPAKEFKDNFPFEDVISIFLPKQLYDSYYNDFCNDVIWPLFHYEGNRVKFDVSAWKDYIKVNKVFADRLLKILEDGDTVWIHDFHFFLLPQLLRASKKNIKIGFFLHIPFPSSEIFRQLPVRREILENLLHSDLIGFHDYSYLRHFNNSVLSILGVESDFLSIQHKKRKVRLGVFPVSIETNKLQEQAGRSRVMKRVHALKSVYKTKVIVGVDRLDYSKGIDLKLLAFKQLLENHPELIGKVCFVQLAVPSRINVEEYAQLKHQIEQSVGEINGKYGNMEYVPVRYIFNSVDQTDLLALYRMSDVLFVGSKRDGMNLVSLEFVASQDKDDPGAVVLSEFTGAASILSEAFRINPWDTHSTAEALYEALQLPKEDRVQKHENSLQFLKNYTSIQWAQSFLQQLNMTPKIQASAKSLFNGEESDETKNAITTKLHKQKIALFLDFDGTLAPIIDDPKAVQITSTLKSLVKRLSKKPNIKVVIVSGRNSKYLQNQFKDIPVDLACEHGASYYSHERNKWESFVFSNVKPWMSAAKTIMTNYTRRVPGSFIEKKNACIVWHYRMAPTVFAEYQAKKLVEELGGGLSNYPAKIMVGKKNVEVRAFETNKGSFITSYLARSENKDHIPVAIGDDVTDEDMFRAIGKEGITVKVGREETLAQYRINDQSETTDFLNLILKI